jgi:hypothetical protein
MRVLVYLLIILSLFSCNGKQEMKTMMPERWSKEKAWEWYNRYDWLVGTNFNPSTAINQLEFWQNETFDLPTIDKELSWSADLGMNVHRVFLHNLLWEQDSTGFIKRLENFLTVAKKYNIRTMFVLLDDVWHPIPKSGKQPEPIPHLHNSGWVQAPGAAILGDSTRHDELEGYIKGIMRNFANDDRVLCWDLYNEPDNVAQQKGRAELEVQNKHIYSLALLKKVFQWAREINPVQPLTVGIWRGDVDHWGTPDSLPELDRYMVTHSDVISFHAYDNDMNRVKQKISELKKYGRPLLCTEYMARTNNNTFNNMLPILKENSIAAINWGFVSGKTNTIYPWQSWRQEFTSEPEIWFHDIFRNDGTPFSKEEIEFIRQMTNKN